MSGQPKTEPIPVGSVADLVAFARAGEKPRAAWRVGTEHEKIGLRLAGKAEVLSGLTAGELVAVESEGPPAKGTARSKSTGRAASSKKPKRQAKAAAKAKTKPEPKAKKPSAKKPAAKKKGSK